jgi:hypothetical protein
MDNKIKEALEYITEEYSPSEHIYNSIVNELKGESNMKKKISIKKFAVCFAVAAVLLTVGVTAASRYAKYSYSSASHADKINHAPTTSEVKAVVDYLPKYTDKIGDYTLVSAQPSDSSYSDENGNEIANGKEISFEYQNGDSDKTVTLFTSGSSAQFEDMGEAIKEVNGITLYYSSTTNKFVPPDYKPTPEEEQQVKEGTLNIGYGSSEIEVIHSEYLAWIDGGIQYGLMTMGNDLGSDTLTQMATDIINS